MGEKIKRLAFSIKEGRTTNRVQAAIALGKIKHPRSAKVLIRTLGFRDGNANVREAARNALVELGPIALKPLIAALRHKEDEVREDAARCLGRIGDTHAIDPLIAVLKDIGSGAVTALSNIDPNWRNSEKVSEAVPVLIAALKSKKYRWKRWSEWHDTGFVSFSSEYHVKRKVIEVLGKIKDPRAIEPLIAVMKGMHGTSVLRESKSLQEHAATALGEMKNPLAVEPLIALLKDKYDDHPNLHYTRVDTAQYTAQRVRVIFDELARKDTYDFPRHLAADALGKIGDRRAVEPLIDALIEAIDDPVVRAHAVRALGEIKDRRAVEHIIVALRDDTDYHVRFNAAYALWEMADVRAVESLIAALEDEYRPVRQNAAIALFAITRRNFGEDKKRWQEWWKKNKGTFATHR